MRFIKTTKASLDISVNEPPSIAMAERQQRTKGQFLAPDYFESNLLAACFRCSESQIKRIGPLVCPREILN